MLTIDGRCDKLRPRDSWCHDQRRMGYDAPATRSKPGQARRDLKYCKTRSQNPTSPGFRGEARICAPAYSQVTPGLPQGARQIYLQFVRTRPRYFLYATLVAKLHAWKMDPTPSARSALVKDSSSHRSQHGQLPLYGIANLRRGHQGRLVAFPDDTILTAHLGLSCTVVTLRPCCVT